MKKNLHEIFDEAQPNELDIFDEELNAQDLPPRVLASLKRKAIKKAGLKKEKRKQKDSALRIGVLAACVCLVIGAFISSPFFIISTDDGTLIPGGDGEQITTPTYSHPEIPTWDNAHYSAEEIAALFNSKGIDAVATNAYTTVYVSDSKFLNIGKLPTNELIKLYVCNPSCNHTKSQGELGNFVNGILPELSDFVDTDIPQYEIQDESDDYGDYLRVDFGAYPYNLHAAQTKKIHRFSLWYTDSKEIVLDGETVQIDQRLSDSEIINSLQSVKNKLFDIFGVSFTDAKTVRYFNGHSENGAEAVYVYFYNENAHPLNSVETTPISDYIRIYFDNHANLPNEVESNSILSAAEIDYYKHRYDPNEYISAFAEHKMISLEDAEVLLYNGYVFGAHICYLCMQLHDKVSFESYDFVDIQYVFGYDTKTGEETFALPFYAFYKNIGTAKNGNLIYAKTYVPAIEVSGLQEYLENQAKYHKNIG